MYKDKTSEVTFNLKAEHIHLLSQSYVSWSDVEFGAACIDEKRPYGNSDVLDDLRSLIWRKFGYMTSEKELTLLHSETETALQIILSTGSFEVGTYVAKSKYSNEWEKVVTPEYISLNIAAEQLVSPVYISGPITGMYDGNKDAFDKMAAYLESLGFEVVNPRRNPIPKGTTLGAEDFWNVMMQESLKIMMECNSIVLLKGWCVSRGAGIEQDIAASLDWPIAKER